VAQNSDSILSRLVFVSGEYPAKYGLHAENVETMCRHFRAAQLNGIAESGECHQPPALAAMYWKTEFCACQSRKLRVDIPFLVSESPGGFSNTRTVLSAFA
jgi:hypothetical protein